jgi:ribonuclease HII
MRTEEEIKIKINETLYTAMVDECGAGPLCGDLVVAAVILDPNNPIVGLNDSKKLTEKKRELLYPQIIEKALDYCIIHISPKEIDKINIFQARMLGMKMAIEGLKRVDYAVIDGNKIPQGLVVEADYVIKGDAKIEGIGAASILAKVTRDRQMEEQSKIYPGYGFEKHKGYGTKVHMDALKELGPCEIHRFSYAPVREAVR